MILLDTHVLIWWITDDKNLPSAVRQRLQDHKKSGEIAVSSMTFWEIALLYKKGRLQLAYDVQSWVDRVTALPFLKIVDPNHHILVKSVLLPEPFYADPADRIIVSTAMDQGATLITKDDKIRNYRRVETFWRE